MSRMGWKWAFKHKLALWSKDDRSPLKLENRSRVAVIGGGPAGSFFSYFLMDMADRAGLEIRVDIYEPRDFSRTGPAGCNHCGGIVSESLVQLLAVDGINLPPSVVQRGINAYVLHMDAGSVRIDMPLQEKRIAAVFRGAGPRGMRETRWGSFDGYLQKLAAEKGARRIHERAANVGWEGDRPQIETAEGLSSTYDLIAVTAGVNSRVLQRFEELRIGYRAPRTTKAYVGEFALGQEKVQRYLGNSMHVFLLNIPRLEFAALIPKGDYVTVCLLGEEIDGALVKSFLDTPEVRRCFPPGWHVPQDFCHCSPRMNVQGASHPFADRMVFIGDCGVTRLYKDGIGAAYRAAKAAASTVVFEGISAKDFERHYWPSCQAIGIDNMIGKVVFAITRQLQKRRFTRRAVLRMVSEEQHEEGGRQDMSTVLWDMFTGSAPYRDVFMRTLHPIFLARFLRDMAIGMWPFGRSRRPGPGRPGAGRREDDTVEKDALGKVYRDGEIIVYQGEMGDSMYVIQAGQVEILQEEEGTEVRLAVLSAGDFFGEMAIFEHEVRSATARALGEVRVLTIDEDTFLRRIHEDPSLAFRVMQKMSQRVRKLDGELFQTKTETVP